MKKILLSLLTICSAFGFSASAQTFLTSAADTVWGNITPGGTLNLHNDIKSASASPIKITWHIDDYSFAPKMGTGGVCDNSLCRDSSSLFGLGATFTSDDYTNVFNEFKAIFTDYGAANGAKSLLAVTATSGATTRHLVFIVTKVQTSVPSVNVNDNITMFPNPAKDFINVLYDAKANIKTAAIYNLIGKTIQVYKVSDNNSAKLDLNNIPSGIYFLRLMNANGQVVATRRFTRQ